MRRRAFAQAPGEATPTAAPAFAVIEGVPLRAEDLPAGTVLRREYKGVVHVVYVLPTCNRPGGRVGARNLRRRRWRYLYRGKRYGTLTAICFAITGWRNYTGTKFFRLAG